MSAVNLPGRAPTALPRSEGVLAVDMDGKVIYVNRATERMCGRARHELLGHPLAHLFETVEGFEVTGKPIHDRSGSISGAIIVFRDAVEGFQDFSLG